MAIINAHLYSPSHHFINPNQTARIDFNLDLARYTIAGASGFVSTGWSTNNGSTWVATYNLNNLVGGFFINGGSGFSIAPSKLMSANFFTLTPASNSFADFDYFQLNLDFSAIALITKNDSKTQVAGPGQGTTVDAAGGVLTNDYDPYHYENLSVTGIRNSAGVAGTVGQVLHGLHGDLTINANGSYSYVSTDNFRGPDVFTYTVTDTAGGANLTSTATLTIIHDRPPDAVTHDVVLAKGTTRSASTGDTDPDGGVLTVVSVNGSASNVGIQFTGTYGHLTLWRTGHTPMWPISRRR